jgi:hypothetical protein
VPSAGGSRERTQARPGEDRSREWKLESFGRNVGKFWAAATRV